MTDMAQQQFEYVANPYARIAWWCGVGAVGIGIAGLLGWIFNLPVLTSIVPGLKPIAVSAAIAFLLLGIIQLGMARPRSRVASIVLFCLALLLTLFGLLEIIYLVTGSDVSIEDAILRHYPGALANPNAHIAPVAGIFIFLLGLGQSLFLYHRGIRGRQEHRVLDVVGLLGSLVMLCAFVFLLGYLYGTPLFYGSAFIPISALATLAATLLGIGLILTAGEEALPLRWFTGSSTRAQLLRAFLPFTALVLLFSEIVQNYLARFAYINPALSAALLTGLSLLLISVVVLRIARGTGNLIDRAQAERQQAIEELRLLSAALESAANGVVITDRQGQIIWVNPAFTRLTGYTLDEVKGENPHLLNSGQQPHSFFATMWETIENGEPWHGQLINRRKDGSLYTEEQTITPVRAGGVEITHFVAIKEDITERKQIEEALRVSEATFRTIFNSVYDAIFLHDVEGRILEVNDSMLAMYGVTREEVPGTEVARYSAADNPFERLPDLWHRVLAGEPQYFSWHALRPHTGEAFDVEVYLRRLHLHGREVIMANVRDVTARKQAEAALRALTETLEQRVRERTVALEAANKELEAFSFSVSHDLRAPLRSIDGFSRILLERYLGQLDAAGQDYLTRVRNATLRMSRLIDDMLMLSRVGRAEMRRAPVNLSALAADVMDELRQRDPERQVQVAIQPDLEVTGDAGLLRIVLENLLGNAWKFTSHREEARIEVGALTRDGERIYYVRDNGAGFDMSYADKLFTPFQRLHSEEEFPGTGIGLAIVQRIITRHGGRVWAEGEEGKGATVYFTLGA